MSFKNMYYIRNLMDAFHLWMTLKTDSFFISSVGTFASRVLRFFATMWSRYHCYCLQRGTGNCPGRFCSTTTTRWFRTSWMWMTVPACVSAMATSPATASNSVLHPACAHSAKSTHTRAQYSLLHKNAIFMIVSNTTSFIPHFRM